MKNFLTLICLLLNFHTMAGKLSEKVEISILTCSPGIELYSLFGHTAIRVVDPETGMDIVFNYGTFDFNTSNFYIKYAQGLLPYQLSITSYDNFINSYKFDNRSVWSQTLQLSPSEKQKLFDLLAENYEPENRTYLYNFLFDNCSTRVRDIIEKSTDYPIIWKAQDTEKNFWNLLDEYLYAMPWVQWGIHTILGQPGTQTADTRQYLFLPDYLMYALDSASCNGKRLVSETTTEYQAPPSVIHSPWYFSPAFILALGAVFVIFLIQYFKSVKLLNFMAVLFFVLSGLIGILLVFLGFFTEHPITAPNLNLVWANPVNLIVIYFLVRKQLALWVHYYLLIYTAILILGIPLWFIAIPAVPLASLSIIILMIYLNLKLKQRKFH